MRPPGRANITVAIVTAVLAAVASTAAAAQTDRARALLDRAVAALGGVERLAAAPAWVVEGKGREDLTAELQGLRPNWETWRPHEEAIAVYVPTLAVAWERHTPRNDGSLRWRRFIRRGDSSGVFDWNVGRGRMRAGATPEADRRALARRVPHLLLLEARTRATAAAWRGETRVDNVVCDAVEVTFPEGFRLTLSIGRDTPVLRRAEYTIDFPGAGVVAVSWEWWGWLADSALAFSPRGHRVVVDGWIYQEVTYGRYGPNVVAARALLTLPPARPPAAPPMAHAPAADSMPPAPAADALAATGEVAPGVHVLEVGAFTVFAVEFRDFIVAIEAPENHPALETIPGSRDTTGVTAAFLRALRATAPGKPVRYAILSHHHSDHLGGARTLAAAGVTLIVAPGHREAARRAAGSRATIDTVGGRRTISDGTRALEIVHLDRNPHTEECLFVWLPAERILFQGDLFYYDRDDTFPPPGREFINRFFARWLESHGFKPRAVYGVHGFGAATERELEAMRR